MHLLQGVRHHSLAAVGIAAAADGGPRSAAAAVDRCL